MTYDQDHIDKLPRYSDAIDFNTAHPVWLGVETDEQDKEVIDWIVENTSGLWCSPTMGDYYFSDPADAAHFKLRWV